MSTSHITMAAKAYDLLTREQRKQGAVLLGLLVVGMALETLGIGLVIPAIALLVEADPRAAFPMLGDALAAVGNPGQVEMVTAGMLVLVVLYVVKAGFLAWLSWYQHRIAFGIQEEVSRRLVITYLHQPYTFHLQRNSAELIRNAITEVHQLWFFVLSPVTIALSEGLVLVGITGLLLVVEPLGAVVVVLALGAAAAAFYRYTRARVERWGVARQHHDGQRMQHLQQALGAVKEVKLLGREAELVARYAVHNAESARVWQRQATVQQLPRLWIELLAVAGLASLVIVMLAQGQQPESVVPTLGLFAAAAFRMMPSVYRVLGALQNLPYGVPIIETLHAEIGLGVPQPATVRPSGPFREAIELEGVHFTYPGAAAPALSGVSLTIRRGEFVGFVGASGSGKSTLLDVVLGLFTPTAGRVRVDGRDIQEDLRGWQRQVGYVPQSVYLTDDSLRRNIAFGVPPDQIDDGAVERAVIAAQLDAFVAALPQGMDTVVGERGVRLSGGQRQRIGIARALYHDPAVLVLDEATSALDSATERDVMEAVEALQGSKTLLIVAHRLSTVERCSKLYRLDGGRIAAEGAPADLLGVPSV